MSSLSQKLTTSGAVCGLALLGLTAHASAAVVTYTDFGTFQAAASSLMTDSFEVAPWTPIGTKAQGLSNLGVSWTSADSLFSFGGISHSANTAITSSDGPTGFDAFDWVQAALPANTTAVGGWITSFNQAHQTELRAYDALDNLLGSVSLGSTGNAYAFLGLTADTTISKVRFVSTNVTNPIGDDFAIDDFSFGGGNLSVPVPEPSTFVLFGAVLAGLAFGRRRAKTKASSGDLDRRTLADIGIDPGTILWAVHGRGFNRLRRSPFEPAE